jgi:Mrp family chromosome partitioning ATPase
VALVVARKDEARLSALQDLVQGLTSTSTQVVGVVMNEF